MAGRYIHGIVDNNAIIGAINADNVFEINANEFRKIFYCLGLFLEYSRSSCDDFDKFLTEHNCYSINVDDSNIDFRYIIRGIVFTRDHILSETNRVHCSGIMLRKLAYKGRCVPAAIPRNADIIIKAILDYVCKEFSNRKIRACFLNMIGEDTRRYADANHRDRLDIATWQDASLTFQVQMLSSKDTLSAQRLLARIRQIDTYNYIQRNC